MICTILVLFPAKRERESQRKKEVASKKMAGSSVETSTDARKPEQKANGLATRTNDVTSYCEGHPCDRRARKETRKSRKGRSVAQIGPTASLFRVLFLLVIPSKKKLWMTLVSEITSFTLEPFVLSCFVRPSPARRRSFEPFTTPSSDKQLIASYTSAIEVPKNSQRNSVSLPLWLKSFPPSSLVRLLMTLSIASTLSTGVIA